jgi:hypothetical protein
MSFSVIVKQIPESGENHFEYECLLAVNHSVDKKIRELILLPRLKELQDDKKDEYSYFLLNLENVESVFTEEVVGRIVTTKQVIKLLATEEFQENVMDVYLGISGIMSNHYLELNNGIILDSFDGLPDTAHEWEPEVFLSHYKHANWRINSN